MALGTHVAARLVAAVNVPRYEEQSTKVQQRSMQVSLKSQVTV